MNMGNYSLKMPRCKRCDIPYFSHQKFVDFKRDAGHDCSSPITIQPSERPCYIDQISPILQAYVRF